jgi:hypothetical protein
MSRLLVAASASFSALACGLLFASTPALAAAPEEPETGKAEPITNTTAVLHGTVNPLAPAPVAWFFRSHEGAECTGAGSSTTPAEPEEGVSEVQALPAEAKLTGLKPGTQYTFCLVVRNEAEEVTEGKPASFTTTAVKPTVAEESFSNLTSSEATLSARINPEGLTTTFKVEYGTAEPLASSAEVTLPAAEGPVGVLAHLTGLTPQTVYHYRFVATNTLGSSTGEDAHFETLAAAGVSALTLPDNRVYELVSAPDGPEAYSPDRGQVDEEVLRSQRPFRASADGSAVAYIGDPPPSGEGGTGSQGDGLGNQYLASRTAGGWSSLDVTPTASNLSVTAYEAFSDDLSFGILHAAGRDPLLTADAPEHCSMLYARDSADSEFRSLFTTAQTMGACTREELKLYAGASSDGSRLFFQSSGVLTGEAAAPPEEEQENLYESVGGVLHSINILGGAPDPNATFGGPKEREQEESLADFSHAISNDGSRVFWTDLNTRQLYVRVGGTSTVPVSSGPARFWTASPDGRYAYYTEEEGPEEARLIRFDLTTETREEIAPASGDVQGVIGVNETGEDGAYLYFVAAGVLASNTNSHGEAAVSGQPNVYLRHGGSTTFIATLARLDNQLVGPSERNVGDWSSSLGDRTAALTPDGMHLVFESLRPLTGYNNKVSDPMIAGELVQTEGAVPEAFLYDAGVNRTTCVSCSQSGAPLVEHLSGSRPVNVLQYNTMLPVSSHPTYVTRWLSADGGRVFFDSAQPLVPQDTNGRQDVYEWEREGVGSCPSGRPDGCVFLLSGGSSAAESFLVDASANGSDVFFTTRGQLTPQDRDGKTDLYDARVDGGFPTASLACTGTGCQGVPPAPPAFDTPPSVTFNGTGNFPPPPKPKMPSASERRAKQLAKALRACRQKRNRHKRKVCESKAKKRYGTPKAAKHGKAGSSMRRGK